MAQLNDLLVLGKTNFLSDIWSNGHLTVSANLDTNAYITLLSNKYPQYVIKNTECNRAARIDLAPNGWLSIHNRNDAESLSSSSGQNSFIIRPENGTYALKDQFVFQQVKDGVSTYYNIYGTHNKPTAADCNALSLLGGTLTGTLFLSPPAGNTELYIGRKASKRILFRNDDSSFYFLIADANNDMWNDLRPLTINLSTGTCNISGNAATATKLATARTISLGQDLIGSASFNGSSNITINANLKYCSVNGGNQANYPYHRIMYREGMSSAYNDTSDVFLITHNYNGGPWGLIKISYRTNNSGAAVAYSAEWLIRSSGMAENVITMASWGTTGEACYCDVFYKCGTWPRCTITRVGGGTKGWTMIDSREVDNTTTSDPLTSTNCYKDISTAATKIRGKAYSSTATSKQSAIYGAVWN